MYMTTHVLTCWKPQLSVLNGAFRLLKSLLDSKLMVGFSLFGQAFQPRLYTNKLDSLLFPDGFLKVKATSVHAVVAVGV